MEMGTVFTNEPVAFCPLEEPSDAKKIKYTVPPRKRRLDEERQFVRSHVLEGRNSRTVLIMADASEQMVRPNVDDKGAAELAKRLWGVHALAVVKLNGYDDKNFWLKDVQVVGNENISDVNDPGYVLKITNSIDSKNEDEIVEQNTILQNLAQNGVECPQPQKTITGKLHTSERLEPNGPLHILRLLTFVPGEVLSDLPWNSQFAYQAGQHLAQIDKTLESTPAPALEKRRCLWSLWEAPKVRCHIDVVNNEADYSIVSEVLASFQEKIVQRRESQVLKEALIHGDYNTQNILVRRDSNNEPFIAAVLDLGDAHRAPLLFEIAMAAAYLAVDACASGEEAADAALKDVAAEYRAAGGWLPENEARLLKLCVCARLAQSLVLGLQTHREDPSNIYVLGTQQYGWRVLRHFWAGRESYCSLSNTNADCAERCPESPPVSKRAA